MCATAFPAAPVSTHELSDAEMEVAAETVNYDQHSLKVALYAAIDMLDEMLAARVDGVELQQERVNALVRELRAEDELQWIAINRPR